MSQKTFIQIVIYNKFMKKIVIGRLNKKRKETRLILNVFFTIPFSNIKSFVNLDASSSQVADKMKLALLLDQGILVEERPDGLY